MRWFDLKVDLTQIFSNNLRKMLPKNDRRLKER